MTQITKKQYDTLVQGIYDSYMSNEDMGLGEMGDCREEATRIVDEWMEKNAFYYDSEDINHPDFDPTRKVELPEKLTLLVTGTGKRDNETTNTDLLLRTCDHAIYLPEDGPHNLAHTLVDRYNAFNVMLKALNEAKHFFRNYDNTMPEFKDAQSDVSDLIDATIQSTEK